MPYRHKSMHIAVFLVSCTSVFVACKTTQTTRQMESSPYYRLEALTDLDSCSCITQAHDLQTPLSSDEVVADCSRGNIKTFYDLSECQNSIAVMEGIEAEEFSGVSVLSYSCNEVFLKDQRCGETVNKDDALTLSAPKSTALIDIPPSEENAY